MKAENGTKTETVKKSKAKKGSKKKIKTGDIFGSAWFTVAFMNTKFLSFREYRKVDGNYFKIPTDFSASDLKVRAGNSRKKMEKLGYKYLGNVFKGGC